MSADRDTVTVRLALTRDAGRMAELHAQRISEGFLPSLGPAFLTRLYRRIARSDHAFAFVAEDHDGQVGAFAAAATDVRGLYKEFLRRDGIVAAPLVAMRLARSPRALRKVVQTLRYPAAAGDLPEAEILAVATDAAVEGRGMGSQVVHAATKELARRGCDAAKVVTGGDNAAALRMYQRCGFATHTSISLHDDVVSEVLVWPRS